MWKWHCCSQRPRLFHLDSKPYNSTSYHSIPFDSISFHTIPLISTHLIHFTTLFETCFLLLLRLLRLHWRSRCCWRLLVLPNFLIMAYQIWLVSRQMNDFTAISSIMVIPISRLFGSHHPIVRDCSPQNRLRLAASLVSLVHKTGFVKASLKSLKSLTSSNSPRWWVWRIAAEESPTEEFLSKSIHWRESSP